MPQSCGNLGISSFIEVEGKNLPFDHDFTTNVTWDNEDFWRFSGVCWWKSMVASLKGLITNETAKKCGDWEGHND